MKLKHKLFLSALLASAAISSAQAAPFDGAYIGAQGGYEMFNVDETFTGAGALTGTTSSNSFDASGATGGLYAGYGKRFDNFYLGAEIEGDLANADHSASSGGISTQVENKRNYGASVRIGYLPTNSTLLYGRAGWVRSEFDYSISAPAAAFSLNDSTSLNGFRAGLGAETALMGNITARADWVYTRYQDFDLTVAGVGTDKFSPDSNTFRIGLAYNF